MGAWGREVVGIWWTKNQGGWKRSHMWLGILLAASFMLVSCLACSSTQKMEVTCSSETLVVFSWTAWLYMPEDIILQILTYENLEICMVC
jgi:hypothetical protein